jgi:hypothetical protein
MSNAKAAILKLMNQYTYLIDGGYTEGFAGLFEHASFHVIGDPGGVLNGKQEVLGLLKNVTMYDGKPHTKHVMTNVQIDVDDSANSATAQSYVTVFQALPPDFPLQAIFIGHYHDVFEQSGGQWRFRSREISPDLIGDLSRHRADMS